MIRVKLLLLLIAATYAMLANGKSRLAEGRWVKIDVTATGLQQLRADELAAMGFSDPAKVGVYGFGGVTLASHPATSPFDDLPEVPSLWDEASGKLIFYGEADTRLVPAHSQAQDAYSASVVRNFYADHGSYFLTQSSQPRRVEVLEQELSEAPTIKAACGVTLWEEEMAKASSTGARVFGRPFVDSPVQEFSVELPGAVASRHIGMDYLMAVGAKKCSLTISLNGGTGLSVTAQGPLALRTGYAYNMYAGRISGPAVKSETLSVKLDASGSRDLTSGAPDYLLFSYPRSTAFHEASASRSAFYFFNISAAQPICFSNVKEGVQVWDVSTPSSPLSLQGEADGKGNLVVGASRNGDAAGVPLALMVFDPSATLNIPSNPREVTRQDLHSLPAPEMMIIATRECLPQARRLAEIHCGHGVKAQAVGQEEVYNEYSSGVTSPAGLRLFLRSLKGQQGSPLRSVLLFGAAHHSPKGVGVADAAFADHYLPIFEAEDSTICGSQTLGFATDAYYGSLGDGFNPLRPASFSLDIAVGRIPALTEAQAATAVDKIERALASPIPPMARVRSLQMADFGNENGHLLQGEETVGRMLSAAPAADVQKLYFGTLGQEKLDVTVARQQLEAQLEAPAGYIGYCGHAYFNTLGSNDLLSPTRAANLANGYLPFMMISACDFGALDSGAQTMGASLLFNPHGGSATMVASGRAVIMDLNQRLSLAVAEAYHKATSLTKAGQVFQRAFNSTVTPSAPRTVAINTLAYNFIGDPEMPVPASSDGEVVVTSLPTAAQPGEKLAIKGFVSDKGTPGQPDPMFNGQVTLLIYQQGDSLTTRGFSNDVAGLRFGGADELLAQYAFEVKSGRFQGEFAVPQASRVSDVYPLRLLAVGNDAGRAAKGLYTNFAIQTGSGENTAQAYSAPVIAEITVDPLATHLSATIVADNAAGIVGASTFPGRQLRLTIDGRAVEGAANALLVHADGTATLEVPLSELSAGSHEAWLRVSNNMGASTEQTLTFEAPDPRSKALLTATLDGATMAVTLDLEHRLPSTPGCRLVVENMQGQTVYTSEAPAFPVTFQASETVPPGRYTARCFLNLSVSCEGTDAPRSVPTQMVETPPVAFTLIN